jgi:DNA oxidative demethylase
VRKPQLFASQNLPDGLVYEESFLSPAEERTLLEHIRALEFQEVRMHGVAAKRRVVQYGWQYSFDSSGVVEGEAIPDFLLPVRDQAAALADVAPNELSEALITEYPPDATMGWHGDAPGFGIVVGISLLSTCRFRFRRGRTGAWQTEELLLPPRSAYVLRGPARSEWQHSIPAVKEPRYSITFRTIVSGKGPSVEPTRYKSRLSDHLRRRIMGVPPGGST